MTPAAGDRATVTAFVDVAPADAFEVFTLEIDRWWRRGPAYRVAGRSPGVMHLEPRLGGRIFEEYAAGKLHEVGTITAWEPPARLAFDWRAVNFVAGELTHVEVTFAASGGGTRVVLTHSGWAQIRGDHPVRHGKAVSAFLAELGMWWASLIRSLGERASGDR
jgi:uncharacterized protein YndB with AHSA1/START domain